MNDTLTTPLVSVVIPTYNHANYLGRAIKSVRDQSYANWEVIVIDNHSTDNTDEIIANIADPRIVYFKIHNNGIIAASRNAGMRAAKGDWIAFLDSDDFWYQEKLSVVINTIRGDNSIDVCSTDELQVNLTTGSKTVLSYGPNSSRFYQTLLLDGNRLSPSSTVIKREFLKMHDLWFRENQKFVTAEDYDFWMLIAQAGAKFKFIRSIQGEYLIHASNASGQSHLHQQNIVNVLEDHVYHQQTFQPEKDKLWRQVNARLLMSTAIGMLVKLDWISGMTFLVRAFLSSSTGATAYFFSKLAKMLKTKIAT